VLLSLSPGTEFDGSSAVLRRADDILPLDARQCQILHLLPRLAAVEAIASALGIGADGVLRSLAPLVSAGLVVETKGDASARAHHFAALWRRLPARYGSRPVIVSASDGSRFGAAETQSVVGAIAAWLLRRGLRAGDRIAIVADNHPEYLLSVWAAWLAGAIVVPVDADAPPALVAAILDEVEPALVLCDEGHRAALGSRGNVVQFDPLDGAEPAAEALSALLDESAEPDLREAPEDAPAAILYTSGSTGRPKGVVLTQGALYRTADVLARAYEWRPGDVLFTPAGHHAMSGLRNPTVAALHAGATIVSAGGMWRTQPLGVAETCERYAVTLVTTVPAVLRRWLAERERLGRQAFASLRQVLVTGAGLDEATAEQFTRRWSVSVFNYYGLTETCGVCVLVPPPQGRLGEGVIGVPADALVQVVDEAGAALSPGQSGEIRIFSENLMRGYHRQPALTARVLREGWFYTCDLGQWRDDGMLVLLGRRDDRIKTKQGEVTYPLEVERVLRDHPAIVDTAVIPFVDARGDEQLACFVVVREAVRLDALDDWLEARLGRSRLPARTRLLDEMPLGAGGKVDRNRLRELLDGG